MTPEVGRLRGKVTLNSGAALGIGREIAPLLARESADEGLAESRPVDLGNASSGRP